MTHFAKSTTALALVLLLSAPTRAFAGPSPGGGFDISGGAVVFALSGLVGVLAMVPADIVVAIQLGNSGHASRAWSIVGIVGSAYAAVVAIWALALRPTSSEALALYGSMLAVELGSLALNIVGLVKGPMVAPVALSTRGGQLAPGLGVSLSW